MHTALNKLQAKIANFGERLVGFLARSFSNKNENFWRVLLAVVAVPFISLLLGVLSIVYLTLEILAELTNLGGN